MNNNNDINNNDINNNCYYLMIMNKDLLYKLE